jgi:O-antigen/teichoic acid export membrane protein
MTRRETRVRPYTSGEHERRLATNYFARQASHAVGTFTGVAVITVLARRLPLDEFGVYALLLSLTSYAFVIQGVVEIPAIKALAEALDQPARDRVFSTVIVVYAAVGLAGSMVITGLGAGLLAVWHVPARLHGDALVAVGALAVVLLVSWPTRAFYDALRANQRFTLVAVAEAGAFLATGTVVVILALMDAALWLLVSVTAAWSLATGLLSASFIAAARVPFRFTRLGVDRNTFRALFGLSGYFLIASLSDFVIFSLDRAILGAFRPAATVGLYEGPLRAHNLVRDVQATVVSPVLPAAAHYRAQGDEDRLRELFIRGTRYTVAVVVSLAVVAIVLAGPLLEAWLGQDFGTGAPALVMLVGYWLFYANTSVGWQIVIALGKIRMFAALTAAVALLNLALSLALTPSLGLNGVALGTAVPYLLAIPVFLRIVPRELGVTVAELARAAWLPAYSVGLIVAVGLLGLRLIIDLATVQASAAAGFAALFTYATLYYALWLRPNERLLVRTLARRLVRL